MLKFTPPFLKKKAKTKVGLDIGNCNLRVVEIEEKRGALQIKNAKMQDIRQAKNISEVINKMFKEAGISTKRVNIAVSGDNVIARYLSLPDMTDAELKKAMSFQLEDHIPFKPEEVYADYYILGKEANAKNKMRVFLVAAKKGLLDERVRIVREAGLQPQVITTDTLALKNTFYFNYPSKNEVNITLLNIGDKTTNLLIARQQVPYFIRDTRFGGDAITGLIQSRLQLERKAAEELKHTLKEESPEISKITKAAFGSLVNEIFVSLDFYENLTEQRIDEVYITGGSSQLIGLKEFLAGYLNLEIIPLDPIKKLSLSSNISREEIIKLSPYLAVAIGLALEEP